MPELITSTFRFREFDHFVLNSCFVTGHGHILHRREEVRQCESLHQPPVRTKYQSRQSVHRTPGSPLSKNLLLRQQRNQGG